MVRIKYLSINVDNVRQSSEFYKLLNFNVVDEYYSEDVSMITLSDGNIQLELIEDNSSIKGFNNIGIEVDNIDDELNKLKQNNIKVIDKVFNDNFKLVSLRDEDEVYINLIGK